MVINSNKSLESKKKTNYDMLIILMTYFSTLYSHGIAKKIVPILLYSSILQKFVQYEIQNNTRYRLNVLFHWAYGWFKTSILKRFSGFLPIRNHELTSSSAAALRGSFTDGKFYPPELLINDVLVISELSTILQSKDKEVVPVLLTALEEADIRVALVKGNKVSDSEIAKIKSFGGTFINQRLSFRNIAIIWAGTHTLDNIQDNLRDAFLDRFYVVSVDNSEIPWETASNDPTMLINENLEEELKDWFRDIFSRKSKPNHEFAQKVVDCLKIEFKHDRKAPREYGEMRRIAIAHHDIFPEDLATDVAIKIKFLFKNTSKAKMTEKEKVIECIFQHPRTTKEIIHLTGVKKGTLMTTLRRIGASKTGINPMKYYLDSISEKKQGKKRSKIRTINKSNSSGN